MPSASTAPSKPAIIFRYLAIGSLTLLILAPMGAKLHLYPAETGLILLALAIALSIAVNVRALLSLRNTENAGERRHFGTSGLISLPALLIFLVNFGKGMSVPPIHDISTNTENPPTFVKGVEKRGEDSNSLLYLSDVATQQTAFYTDIAPIMTSLDANAAYERALNCAEIMGLQIYDSDRVDGRIEGYEKTFWFGFIDDMVIRITPNGTDSGSVVDARSVSRLGHGDMGVNAKRVRRFIELFDNDCRQ